MYSRDERDASMMELVVNVRARSRSKELATFPFTPPTMELLANDCVDFQLNAKRPLVRTYKKGKVATYLLDAKIQTVSGKVYLFLLLAISDQRRPDEVLSDPLANEPAVPRRIIEKNNGEGSEHSCHIAISIMPREKNGNQYLAAVESIPHVGLYFINSYIRHLFKFISISNRYSRNDPSGEINDGKYKTVNVFATTNLNGVPSDDLLRDLKKGVLGEIELSKEESAVKGFDQNEFTVPKKTKLLLTPTGKGLNGKVFDVVKTVCSTGALKKYSVAKFTWTGLEGQRSSAKFDCETNSVLTEKYIKRNTFKLPNPLPSSCEKLDDQFCNLLAYWAR